MTTKSTNETHHLDEVLATFKVTLPETNSSHLKIMVSNRNLLFQGSIFRCYVSFREGTQALSCSPFLG